MVMHVTLPVGPPFVLDVRESFDELLELRRG